jgi:VanZ family protein
MAALFFMSSIPGNLPEDRLVGQIFQWFSPNWQNLLHVPLYAGLTASWLWALAERRISHPVWLAVAFLLTIIWAALDEAHQLSVPGRYASLTDLALDLAGALLAVGYAGLNPQWFRPAA